MVILGSNYSCTCCCCYRNNVHAQKHHIHYNLVVLFHVASICLQTVYFGFPVTMNNEQDYLVMNWIKT